jgi:hypothetical protein
MLDSQKNVKILDARASVHHNNEVLKGAFPHNNVNQLNNAFCCLLF